jgi:nitrate reductase gamma subunit
VHDDEVSLLAFDWVAPPFARAAASLVAGVPVGLVAAVTRFTFIMRRAIRQRVQRTGFMPGLAQV